MNILMYMEVNMDNVYNTNYGGVDIVGNYFQEYVIRKAEGTLQDWEKTADDIWVEEKIKMLGKTPDFYIDWAINNPGRYCIG